MKESKKRRRYDAEFKSNVLKMHKDGRSVPSLAASFGVNETLIYRWKKEAKELSLSSKIDESVEIKQLRKQLKETEQE